MASARKAIAPKRKKAASKKAAPKRKKAASKKAAGKGGGGRPPRGKRA